MKFEFRPLAGTFLLVLFLTSLQAEEMSQKSSLGESEDVFAKQGDVVLTQGELDAAFSRIPAEYRLSFIRNGERVDRLVGDLLRIKLAAADAIAAGFDKDPLVKGRISLAAEKELAEGWMAKVKADAPDADYAALAHEYYLANPDKFMTDEVRDVSHILVNNEDRSSEEALQLASSLREQLLEDPSRFEEFVKQYSDDPSKAGNGGRFPRMIRGQMVKPFEDVAFALENVGDLSEPVETNYGYHIIRLNQQYPSRPQPFEDVKAEAMAQAREKYLENYRSRYLRKLVADPIELQKGAVEVMAKRYFGENLELAPEYKE